LSQNITDISKEIYTENQRLIKTESSAARETEIKKAQNRGTLSPAFFTLFMDEIIS
jgi:hypothetical protein